MGRSESMKNAHIGEIRGQTLDGSGVAWFRCHFTAFVNPSNGFGMGGMHVPTNGNPVIRCAAAHRARSNDANWGEEEVKNGGGEVVVVICLLFVSCD